MNFIYLILSMLGFALFALFAIRLWDGRSDRLEWKRLAALQPQNPGIYDPVMVADLPEPARRFFNFAITPGTPLLTVAEIDMSGQFSLGTRQAPNYQRMSAKQILAAPSGFVWKLRLPGIVTVSGSDSGRWTRFRIFGLFPVARMGGNPDHSRAEYGRYVAEALFWRPAALLPGQGVVWEKVNENTARVTVSHIGLSQAVDLKVGGDGWRSTFWLSRKKQTGPRPTKNRRHQMTSHHKCKPSDSFFTSFIVTAATGFAVRVASLSRDAALLGIFALLIGFCCPPAAQAGGTWRSGWFGDIQLGGGMIDANPSGLEVFDDNEKRDRLGDEGSDVSEGFLLIGGEIGYGFQNTGTMVSAGGGMEDPWRISIGQRVGGWGLVSLSAFYEEKEVWENPYLTGVDRDETDAESFGYGLDWDNVYNTGIGIYFKRMEIDVDHDLIGDIEADLRRDGADTTLGMSYPWNLGAGGVLSGSISYILIDRDGEANSGHGYAAELNHTLGWGRFSFATGLELVAREFDEIHPVFNEKREEATFTVSETVSYDEPFGLKNSYLFGVAAYSETVADIAFFEGDAFILGAGVGYRF